MRVLLLAGLYLLSSSANGFIPSFKASTSSVASSSLSSSRAEEAAQLARQQAEAARQRPETPKLFGDDLLADMQECLLKLERRVKHGPGALSMLEVEEFDFAAHRILEEMKRNEHNRPKPAPAFPDVQVEEVPAGTTEQSSPQSVALPPPPPRQNPQQQYQQQKQAPPAAVAGSSDNDRNPEEGPAFNGSNGFGLASGTTNTYVIPGMDEMSPEEYQAALQKSVSDRQAERVKTGVYGNKAVRDYLSNLGGTGQKKKTWDPNDYS